MDSDILCNGEHRLRWLPVLFLLTCALPAAAEITLRWVSNPTNQYDAWVEVAPLQDFSLPADKSAWNKLLSVRVGKSPPANQLPMAGTHSFEEGILTFRPLFPLDPGLHYTATYQSLTAGFTAPERPASAATTVSKVAPSLDTLPLNLLKFYLHFSAPMTRGSAYQHIRLLDDQGKRVADPFLELPEELWNPEMTRLTVLLDPGRIKRGLLPNQVVGAVFKKGNNYTLSIDRSWPDATGNLLEGSFTKSFRAGPPDYTQPDPTKWRFQYPSAGTRDPLRITFAKSLDAALATRLLTIRLADARVAGTTSLSAHESVWEFRPAEPWSKAPHLLRIDHRLEDLAGNSIERPFEEGLDKHPEKAGLPPAHSIHKFTPGSSK